ncbi:hypothetical protein EPO05_00210 [Patescibacteria group bacterium]|nr:MAG: hypothetical protein EPO05_00210 [Patescibacteria group bacterium]
MSEVLEYLFGSRVKTRLLRFFLLNPEGEFSVSELVLKNILNRAAVQRELRGLKKIKFVIERSRQNKKYYLLNTKFPFYPELRGLIVKSNVYPQCRSLGKLKEIGDVKLALISGVFLNYPKSKVDMIMVVDNLNRTKLKNLMTNLEAEIGKEVRFVVVTGEEFKYRMNMLDRFLMDFLESPYDEIVNRIPTLRNFVAGLRR